MKQALTVLASILLVSGCASTQVYNPVSTSLSQTFVLNQSALAQVKTGMKQTEVHQIMGDSILIGYAYAKPISDEASVDQSSAKDYKPLTISNPYKSEDIKTSDGVYTVEYYVHSIKQTDGVLTDDELVPLVFHNGLLTGRGWDYLKGLRLKNPS